jgi:hypothetical protein
MSCTTATVWRGRPSGSATAETLLLTQTCDPSGRMYRFSMTKSGPPGRHPLEQGQVAGQVLRVGQVLHPQPQHLVARAADEVAESPVDPHEAPLQVGQGDPDGHLIDQRVELLLPPAQRHLGPPPLGGVAQDLAEAEQLPTRVAQGDHDAGGPEPGAVLAQVPALVLGPPLGQRRAQLLPRARRPGRPRA